MPARSQFEEQELWQLARIGSIAPSALDAAIATLERSLRAADRTVGLANAAELLTHLRFAVARNDEGGNATRQFESIEAMIGQARGRPVTALVDDYTALSRRIKAEVATSGAQTPESTWNALRQAWRNQAELCASLLPRRLSSPSLARFGLTESSVAALFQALDLCRKEISALPGAAAQARDTADYKPWYGSVVAQTTDGAASFDEARAINLVAAAFDEQASLFGDVVRRLADDGLIDVAFGASRQDMAFCSVFNSTGEPRVFAKLDCSWNSVVVLAHELGHALQHVVAPAERRPCVALAETAAIVAERYLRGSRVFRRAAGDQSVRKAAADAALLYLGMIPAIYRFERVLDGLGDKALSVEDLDALMQEQLEPCFGKDFAAQEAWLWQRVPLLFMQGARYAGAAYAFAYLFSGHLVRGMTEAEYRTVFSRRDATVQHEGLDRVDFWHKILLRDFGAF